MSECAQMYFYTGALDSCLTLSAAGPAQAPVGAGGQPEVSESSPLPAVHTYSSVTRVPGPSTLGLQALSSRCLPVAAHGPAECVSTVSGHTCLPCPGSEWGLPALLRSTSGPAVQPPPCAGSCKVLLERAAEHPCWGPFWKSSVVLISAVPGIPGRSVPGPALWGARLGGQQRLGCPGWVLRDAQELVQQGIGGRGGCA